MLEQPSYSSRRGRMKDYHVPEACRQPRASLFWGVAGEVRGGDRRTTTECSEGEAGPSPVISSAQPSAALRAGARPTRAGSL